MSKRLVGARLEVMLIMQLCVGSSVLAADCIPKTQVAKSHSSKNHARLDMNDLWVAHLKRHSQTQLTTVSHKQLQSELDDVQLAYNRYRESMISYLHCYPSEGSVARDVAVDDNQLKALQTLRELRRTLIGCADAHAVDELDRSHHWYGPWNELAPVVPGDFPSTPARAS